MTLCNVRSAQVAELIALARTCNLCANLKVTIYTDSQYGFGVAHDSGQLWSQRGFMTSAGTPINNGEIIHALLKAIQLPAELAVVKCSAHKSGTDPVTTEN